MDKNNLLVLNPNNTNYSIRENVQWCLLFTWRTPVIGGKVITYKFDTMQDMSFKVTLEVTVLSTFFPPEIDIKFCE